jgi:hypothetical protein
VYKASNARRSPVSRSGSLIGHMPDQSLEGAPDLRHVV